MEQVRSITPTRSRVVAEEMGDVPEEKITYVEVPVVEDVITHVPRREIVEVEKRVPKYEYEYVERIVEVPTVQTVNKQVEVPHVREVLKHVSVKQVVDVPKEVIKYVPRIETRVVEHEVEVPGDMVEVPKPYLVENKIIVPRYIDSEVPTVVAQRVEPIVLESTKDEQEVVLKEYDPYLVPVDVYIPRPVVRQLKQTNRTEKHNRVDVPTAQFNALVKNLNPALTETEIDTLYRKQVDGSIPMLQGSGGAIVKPVTTTFSSSVYGSTILTH